MNFNTLHCKHFPMSTTKKGSKKVQVQKVQKEQKVQETDEYEVERIIGTKKVGKKIYYRVHWKGFDTSEDTWEPEENLHCPKLLKQFREAQKAAEEDEVQDQETEETFIVKKVISFLINHDGVHRRFLVEGNDPEHPYWLQEEKFPDHTMVDQFFEDLTKGSKKTQVAQWQHFIHSTPQAKKQRKTKSINSSNLRSSQTLLFNCQVKLQVLRKIQKVNSYTLFNAQHLTSHSKFQPKINTCSQA